MTWDDVSPYHSYLRDDTRTVLGYVDKGKYGAQWRAVRVRVLGTIDVEELGYYAKKKWAQHAVEKALEEAD